MTTESRQLWSVIDKLQYQSAEIGSFREYASHLKVRIKLESGLVENELGS